jgi:hypothetical protein
MDPAHGRPDRGCDLPVTLNPAAAELDEGQLGYTHA